MQPLYNAKLVRFSLFCNMFHDLKNQTFPSLTYPMSDLRKKSNKATEHPLHLHRRAQVLKRTLVILSLGHCVKAYLFAL